MVAFARCDTPVITHQVTMGLHPGTRHLSYFRRLSTDDLLALNSVSNFSSLNDSGRNHFSKLVPLSRKQSITLRFLFLTLDGYIKAFDNFH